jgi:hypothetical protein
MFHKEGLQGCAEQLPESKSGVTRGYLHPHQLGGYLRPSGKLPNCGAPLPLPHSPSRLSLLPLEVMFALAA